MSSAPIAGPRQGTITIRPAVQSDLSRIVDINVSALSEDPIWQWRYPYRADFPQDTWNFYHGIYATRIQQPNDYKLMVAECASETEHDGKEKVVCAAALWEIRGLKDGDHTPPATRYDSTYKGPRRDRQPLRAAAYDSITSSAEQDCFMSPSGYGKYRQFELVVMMTHKAYERRGAAKALLSWGIDLADRAGALISLLSTGNGKGFYEKMGWRCLKGLILKTEDEEIEQVKEREPWLWAMIREGVVKVDSRGDA